MQIPIRALVPLALGAAVCLSGCKSTGSGAKVRTYDWRSLDAQLPDGSSATPAHSLSRNEYPFDANGRYVSSWAAEGEKKKGRSPYTSSSNSRKSSSSKKSSKTRYRYHKVRSGDTLWGLSRRYGTTVSAIKRANGLKSDTIVNGRTLKIP